MIAVAQPPQFPTRAFSITPTALVGATSHDLTINGQFVSDETLVSVRLGAGPNIVTNVVWSGPRTLTVTCNFTTEGFHTVSITNGGITSTLAQQVSLATTGWTDLTQTLTTGTDRSNDLFLSDQTSVSFGADGMTLTFGGGVPSYRGVQFNSNSLRSDTASENKTLQGIMQFNTQTNRTSFGWGRADANSTTSGAFLWGFQNFWQNRNQSIQCLGGNAAQDQPTVLNITPGFNSINNNGWYRVTMTQNGVPGTGVVTLHELASGNEADWLSGTLRQTYTIPNATGIVSPSGIIYPMFISEQSGGIIRALRSF